MKRIFINNSGFTLVEALVAFFIIGLVMSSGYSILANGVIRYRLAQAETSLSSGLMIAESLTSRDLRSAYISADERQTGFAGHVVAGEPGGQMSWSQTPSSAQQAPSAVGYFLKRDAGTKKWQLWRRYKEKADGRWDGAHESFVCSDVERFELMFFDGQSWLESWGWDSVSQKAFEGLRGLPLVVSIKLSLRDPQGSVVSSEWLVPVMSSLVNRGLHG